MELPEEEVLAAVLRLFPDAELAGDEDAQLVINTNCMWTGKNGELIMGEMRLVQEIEGEEPQYRCADHAHLGNTLDAAEDWGWVDKAIIDEPQNVSCVVCGVVLVTVELSN